MYYICNNNKFVKIWLVKNGKYSLRNLGAINYLHKIYRRGVRLYFDDRGCYLKIILAEFGIVLVNICVVEQNA